MHVTNLTTESVILKDSFIVGRSTGNADTLEMHAD